MKNNLNEVLLTLEVMSELKKGYKLFVNEQQGQLRINDIIRQYPNVWSLEGNNLTSGGEMNPSSEAIFAEFMKQIAEDRNRGNCTIKITSGNSKWRQDEKKKDPTYDSRHLTGEALDITTSSTSCRNYIKKWLDQYTKNKNGFSYLDEYSNPSEKSTAGHFHMSYRPGKPETNEPQELATSDEIGGDSNYLEDESLVSQVLGKTIDKLTNPIRTNVGNKLSSLVSDSLTEQFDLGDGKLSNGKFIIPANSKILKSPIDGKIISKKFCENQLLIRSNDNNFYLLYCNLTDPSKTIGNVSTGVKLGSSSEDVEITLLTNKFKKIKLESDEAYTLIYPDSKEKEKKQKERKRDKEDTKYYEPAIPTMIDIVTYPLRKKETEKNNKLEENLQRIKKLLN